MSQLVLCLGCARHVRVDDPTCPFCGGTGRGPAPAPRRVVGLGRAALMALGTSVAACGPEATTIEVVTPREPVETVAPSEPTSPSEPIDPVEAVSPAEPIEPSEPIAPSEPSEPSEPVAPTPPRPRTPPADTIGAPVPAYGGAPRPPPEPPRERVRPGPPDDDHGGNVPLYGAPDSED